MRIGSLFSGIGGLDVACEHAFETRTAWQLDLVGADVRRRHWPDALQVEADVRVVDPLSLPPVDILCGGFPCVDLSCAGSQPENPLDTGDRSGLYQEILRFTREIRPQFVVVENVPKLRKLLPRVSRDFRDLGYGLSWCMCEAADAGAPHLRRRVFLLAERGAIGRGEVQADSSGRWTPSDDHVWSTPCGSDGRRGTDPRGAREGSPGSVEEVRVWDTPRANPGGSGRRGGDRHDEEMLDSQVRTWPTPGAADSHMVSAHKGGNPSLGGAVDIRTWATPAATDFHGGYEPGHPEDNKGILRTQVNGRRLSPDWTETLMGLPVGWTLPTGPRLEVDLSPRWPRGRYPASWDRSIPWPGYDWETARTLPDGPPIPGRPGRIRSLGNAVVPAQALLALRALLP